MSNPHDHPVAEHSYRLDTFERELESAVGRMQKLFDDDNAQNVAIQRLSGAIDVLCARVPDNLRESIRDDMRAGFDGINDRLDKLNGRTRKTEEGLARLDERTRVYEQAPPAATDRVNWKNKQVVAASAVGGFAVLYSFFDLIKQALAAWSAFHGVQ